MGQHGGPPAARAPWCGLTIVGGVREQLLVTRRGRGRDCAPRGARWGVFGQPLNLTVRRTAVTRPLNRSSLSLITAALIGVAQMYLLTILWGHISAHNPFPRWLFTLGLKGSVLHTVVFLSDALLNVILCLPAAYALCRLKPPRLLVYLIVAIVPGFLWGYRLFFTDASLVRYWPMFIPGLLLALLPLPLAALLVRRVLVHRTPNNSWRGP